jgi:GT2 family glycosyltransferase
MEQKQCSFNQKILSLIPKEIKHLGELIQLNSGSEQDFKRKNFFRLKTEISAKDIHLTVGQKICDNFEKQQIFYKLLPKFVPKPLFIIEDKENGVSVMGQEFIEGNTIEYLFVESPEKAQNLFLLLKENLDKQIVKSSTNEWLDEFNILKSRVLKINGLRDVDKIILKNEIFPYIENYISDQNPNKRWTNGDLAPRNILVDQDYKVWLIDFEFASQTHFIDEDMVRFLQYSNEMLKTSSFLQKLESKVDCCLKSYFWLKQATLDDETKPNPTKIDFLKVNLSNCFLALEANKASSYLLAGTLSSVNSFHKHIEGLHQEKHITNVQVQKLHHEVRENQEDLAFYLREIEMFRDKIQRMQNSFSWRLTSTLRFLRRKFLDPFSKSKTVKINLKDIPRIRTYSEWVRRYDTIKDSEIELLKEKLSKLKTIPKISILMPVCDPEESFLHSAIQSVIKQVYSNWELCIADDASTNPNINSILKSYAEKDSRIKVIFREKRGHISKTSNAALDLTEGTFVIFLDHDDELREHSLLRIVEEINKFPKVRFIYSDEDKIDEKGHRFDHHFKTDWNPDLLLSQNYICHLVCCEIELLRKNNGFREGFEGAQDWDLFLRITEQLENEEISHIPEILYHWRASSRSTACSLSKKNYVHDAAFKTLKDTIDRRNLRSTPELVDEKNGYWRIAYTIPIEEPLVSILIPTKDRIDLLKTCIDSILKITRYKNFEILILDNQSNEENSQKYFDQISEIKNINVIGVEGAFNYSHINNYGVKQANGNILAFINNDIEITHPEWLHEMVSHSIRKEIGCVGAKLLYPNRTIQHAGVIIGIGGVAGHSFKNFPSTYSGYKHRLQLVQNYSAVTAACLVVEKNIFEQVGGFDQENLKVAFNDVDFCLKVLKEGYRNVWTPHAIMIHHESASRGLEKTISQKKRFQKEVLFMQEEWKDDLVADSFYNPNLTLDSEDFSLSFPPRIPN